ncbi:MAG: hypothetical protein QXT19_00025 [Candidatus Woesearchaeota archaeon]
MTKPSAILLVIVCTLVTSIAQLLWKFGAMRLPQVITNTPLLIGFATYIVAAFLLITSFKGGEVSVLYPMYASNYIWVSLLSAFYLAEPLNTLKFAGMATIIVGVAMLSKGVHKHGVAP